MAYTQEELIKKYQELKEYLGHQPSLSEFLKETGIPRYDVTNAFGSQAFAKLTSASGDTPNIFSKEKAKLVEILIQYGNLARKLGKLPFATDWNFYKCTPRYGSLLTVHGIVWADMPYKFLEFASSNSEWQDVISIIPTKKTIIEVKEYPNKTEQTIAFESQKFLPPIVHDFIAFSQNEKQSLEFEKKANLIFQMLGFDVDDLGQGTGRNPDGIAKASQNGYAIIIDAKTRKDSYSMGTEDRKFIEYIKKYTSILNKSGHGIIYLLLISSNFDSDFEKARINIKIETNVITSLITAKSLLKILAKKIEFPLRFDLRKFQELFLYGGLIEDKKIDKFILGMR